MRSQKNLIRIIALLTLIVMTAGSLSSCLIDIGGLVEIIQNSQRPDGTPDGDEDTEDGNAPPVDFEIIDSENYGEFIEGSGEADTSMVDPAMASMLSTTAIVAKFGSGMAYGSGVIYQLDKEKGDAYIITNYHVIYTAGYGRADSIRLYLYGMELTPYGIPASFVGGSVDNDIAVLRVEDSRVLKNSYAMAATPTDSDKARILDTVYTVGNPNGDGLAVNKGIISVESEGLEIQGADNDIINLRVMRVDAAVNHGNSGGGLYDEEGKLLGIVTAKDVSADVDNVGYVIPINLVVNLANNIIDNCDGRSNTKIKKAVLGVRISSYSVGLEIDPETGDMYKVELVEVTEAVAGSLALGILKKGDIINYVTVDGVTTQVRCLYHLPDAMLNARVGSTVVVGITRDGVEMEFSFTITEKDITTVK